MVKKINPPQPKVNLRIIFVKPDVLWREPMAFAKEHSVEKTFLMDHHQLSTTTIIHNTLLKGLFICYIKCQITNLQIGAVAEKGVNNPSI